MSPRKTLTDAVRAGLLGTQRTVETPKRPKARLSVSQAEDRNAPNSLYSPLDPLADLLPEDPNVAADAAAVAAPSVITVAGADDPAQVPAVPELAAPPAEAVASAGVAVGDLAPAPVSAGDPLVADILWDPGTTPAAITVGDPVQPAVGTAGPAEETAAALPGDPVTGGSAAEATDADVTAPAQLLDPDEAEEEAEGGAGEGTAAMAGPSSGNTAAGDLDIIGSDGVEYPDAKEETSGGWVAVNNDNDNYNFDAADSLKQIYDLQEKTQVLRENDLVGIKVTGATPGQGQGKFTLDWTSGKIKVFKSADKGLGEAKTGEVVVADQKLYVEGLVISEGAGNEQITLNWVPTVGGRQELDKVVFTVYEVLGPLNVPGYSNHAYTLRTPDARVSALTVTEHGDNRTLTSNPNQHLIERQIQWDGGPSLGKFKATPVVGEPFWNIGEVNVVQVDFAFAGADNLLKPNNTKVAQTENLKGVYSSTDIKNSPAMTVTVELTTIVGPDVDGVKRGQRFIDVGMIQVARYLNLHGDFSKSVPRVRRVSSLEGGPFLLDVFEVEGRPWYQKSGASHAYGNFDDAAFTKTTLKMEDSPKDSATDILNIGTDNVDFFSIVDSFEVYLGVHTVEFVNGAQLKYTTRGLATWQFNGSGKVTDDANHKWSKQFDEPVTATGVGKFAEVTDGRVVPDSIVNGTLANVAVLPYHAANNPNGQKWSTDPY